MVKFLIDNGANIEQSYGNEDNPLLHAIKIQNVQIIQILIAYGANLNID